jgi:tyrosine phenol-lyase
MDVTAESVIELMENAQSVAGLSFTHEPKYLRFFQSRFRQVSPAERTHTPARSTPRRQPA